MGLQYILDEKWNTAYAVCSLSNDGLVYYRI